MNLHCYAYIFVVLTVTCVLSEDLRPCISEDFHYEYTECDSNGGRWRVSVPKKPGICKGGWQNPSIRGKDCTFTCKEGQYMDIQGDQECHACSAGTYSLGGGVRFDEWLTLPPGFYLENDTYSYQGKSRSGGLFARVHERTTLGEDEDENADACKKAEWHVRDHYVMSLPNSCSSKLAYSAHLVKPGYVEYEYQYTDPTDFFKFMVQNDRCQSKHEKNMYSYPTSTKEGEWRTVKVPLKTGMNILYWQTMSYSFEKKPVIKPILIRKIEIQGVAYSSSCTSCPNGTYSEAGASSCTNCPENTYSHHGAAQCTKCDEQGEYSEAHSAACLTKPVCGVDDYFAYQTPCTDDRKTWITYKWVKPKICREDLPASVPLPPGGELEDCPPCNLGMQYVNASGCMFCPEDNFSDGIEPCRPCPFSTSPKYGLDYHIWNALPPNVTTECLSRLESGCATESAWIPSGDHIRSGLGLDSYSYMTLNLDLPGFHSASAPKGSTTEPAIVGQVEFVFDLECPDKCFLVFAEESSVKSTRIVNLWRNSQMKTSYTYTVFNKEPTMFTWAFEVQLEPNDTDTVPMRRHALQNVAKIYSIKVTNTKLGGASRCTSCPRGVQHDGCIPCPAGHYIDPQTTWCTLCPDNMVVQPGGWGIESCKACGEGLYADKGTTCRTHCKYTASDGREFDFNSLANNLQGVDVTRLFTSGGTQYYHSYNISLCPRDEQHLAKCISNVSLETDDSSDDDPKQTLINISEEVQSAVCRATIIPSSGEILSAQPVSLGDHLVKITRNASLGELYEKGGFPAESMAKDIHFFYKSPSPTNACTEGRTTIISLHCDDREDGSGTIKMPPKCPDGTCDGCTFHFMWKTKQACPVCQESDYMMIVGECISGKQQVHFIPPEYCIQIVGQEPAKKEKKCSILPFAIEAGIIVGAGLGILMCLLLVYCWKRNKKLEYKYMKLVEKSPGQDGELPAAETCALDEGEEDEQEDSVKFNDSKSKTFFSKFKRSKGNDDFENVNLEKQLLT